jgi:soluble lytic murein transglycosylase-like protein
LLTVAALLTSVSTSAQDITSSQPVGGQATTSTESGHRAVISEGFQLIEHGYWSTISIPQRLPPPQSQQSLETTHPNPVASYRKIAHSDFRRAVYLPHVSTTEQRFSLPPGLLDALIWTESRYNPLAVSSAGAAGLGQLLPATAKELGVLNRFDPLQNVTGAGRYLRQMLEKFGAVHLALAAYNAGPGAVERSGGVPQNGETPDYVREVLRRWQF